MSARLIAAARDVLDTGALSDEFAAALAEAETLRARMPTREDLRATLGAEVAWSTINEIVTRLGAAAAGSADLPGALCDAIAFAEARKAYVDDRARNIAAVLDLVGEPSMSGAVRELVEACRLAPEAIEDCAERHDEEGSDISAAELRKRAARLRAAIAKVQR